MISRSWRSDTQRRPKIPEHTTPHIQTAQEYLRACEAGDFERARSYLTDDFVMVFPGSKNYNDPERRAFDAKTQYRSATKTFLGWSAGETPNGNPVVTSWGTLQGENLNGDPYNGIRYIDIFIFHGDQIREQQVCNDLAYRGVVGTRSPEFGS